MRKPDPEEWEQVTNPLLLYDPFLREVTNDLTKDGIESRMFSVEYTEGGVKKTGVAVFRRVEKPILSSIEANKIERRRK